MAQDALASGGTEAGGAQPGDVCPLAGQISEGLALSPRFGCDKAGCPELLERLRSVAARALEATEADGCAIWLEERGCSDYAVVAASGSLSNGRHAERIVARLRPLQVGAVGTDLASNALRLGRVREDAPSQALGIEGLVFAAPLPDDACHTGGIVLHSCDAGHGYSAGTLEYVRALVQHAVAAAARSCARADAEAAQCLAFNVISTSPNPIIISDLDLRITTFNEAAARLTGRPPRDAIGAHALSLYPPNARPYVQRIMDAAAHQRGAAAFEAEICTQDGEPAPVLLCLRALRDEVQRPHGTVTIVEDLRPVRQLHERLVRAERMRALGQVASGVAHDLNNVLTSVLARAESLLADAQDARVRRGLQVIARAAGDGAGLINQIRDFGRPGTERQQDTVNLSEVVRSALEMSEARLNPAGDGRPRIRLDCRLADEAYVLGNGSELRTVFCNLIDNAAAAMPHGGTLTLATRMRDGRAEASVSDTGQGMSPEAQLRAFDPFFTTKGEAGTGLGLWEAQRIAARHGGTIAFITVPGEGTTFTIELPAAPERPAPQEARRSDGREPKPPCRILVIDDDEQVLETLVEVLESDGHEVHAAPNGPDGLRIFSHAEFDVVVTDLGMPDMCGWDVARAVKESNPTVKVAIVTGWGMQADEALSNGLVDSIITKPFQLTELLDAVRALSPNARRPEAEPATMAAGN